MKDPITISDNDVLDIDDASGNIVVDANKLPDNMSVGETLTFRYIEDPETIQHEYTLQGIEDGRATLCWVKQLGEAVLVEAPIIKLTDDELNNPNEINLRKKVAKATEDELAAKKAAEDAAYEADMKEKHKDILNKLSSHMIQYEPEKVLEMLFEELVPHAGPSSTVAGELVRAMMRLLYRSSNDGDKFFEGYGLETCASSAEYLFDNGFSEDIQRILDNAVLLSEDDDKYEDALNILCQHVVEYINENTKLLWTKNEEDSREYSYDYIEENQPRYEFELYGSDDIDSLVENGVLTSWDLIRYVENQLEWESAYRDAEVARPWSHHDTSVTVTELTKDGYDLLKSNFEHNPAAYWQELVDEHADELSDSDYDDDYEEDGAYEDATI